MPYVNGIAAPFVSADSVAPAGAINSTIVDVAKWARMLLHDGATEQQTMLLPSAAVQSLFAPYNTVPGTPMSYGLGWAVVPIAGARFIYHGGHLPGYSAFVSVIPELGMSVVVLVNDDHSNLDNRIAKLVYTQLFELEQRGQAVTTALGNFLDSVQQPPRQTTPRVDRSLVGATLLATFRHPGYGELKLYRLSDLSFAFQYFENLWPIKSCNGVVCLAASRLAENDLMQEITFETAGPQVTAVRMVTGAPRAESRFVRIP